MVAVSYDAIETVVIAGMAVVGATVIYRFIAPFIGSRQRGETVADHIMRIETERREEQVFQSNLNMAPRKAMAIRLTNVAVVFAVMWLLSCFPANSLVMSIVMYVAVGLILCSWAKLIPKEKLHGLDWSHRLELRLFYVWLWPINVARSVMH